jgi:hypothetical protein
MNCGRSRRGAAVDVGAERACGDAAAAVPPRPAACDSSSNQAPLLVRVDGAGALGVLLGGRALLRRLPALLLDLAARLVRAAARLVGPGAQLLGLCGEIVGPRGLRLRVRVALVGGLGQPPGALRLGAGQCAGAARGRRPRSGARAARARRRSG